MFGRKVIYVRYIDCSYNNVAKVSISLIKSIFVYFLFMQGKCHAIQDLFSHSCLVRSQDHENINVLYAGSLKIKCHSFFPREITIYN